MDNTSDCKISTESFLADAENACDKGNQRSERGDNPGLAGEKFN